MTIIKKNVSLQPLRRKGEKLLFEMDALVQFNIPVSGLKDGLHTYDFQIDSSFFECFEASPLKEGNVNVKVYFDKRPDLYVLTFDLKGIVKTTCDRCLDEFNLPIKGTHDLMVKFDETEHEDADIIYILRGEKSLSIAKYVYEFINLSMPIMKTHDDADEDCNEDIVKYLNNYNFDEKEEESESKENPMWEALKKFKKK
ncbi:MAG: DUF177 domain-containing protein [Bacteroidetes bacterium]|jgi:uncharacterized metal-binding protein YceD (DUF177 family)|nr:DUF177 domain-containing protein [Bacteroidota bacterium]MDF1865219.1 DUF177 domain-containing protein [Saprospiraceae bacterium]